MKSAKIVIITLDTQVYPADEAEDIWHVWKEGRPVCEIQFAQGPVDVDAVSEAVIQDHFDFIVFGPPVGHEQVYEDRRHKPDESADESELSDAEMSPAASGRVDGVRTATEISVEREKVFCLVARAINGYPTTPENMLWLRAWADRMESYRKTPPPTLEQEIAYVLNRFGAENRSNTPDFILAKYLLGCLDAFNIAVDAREDHYGRPSHVCAGPFMPAPGRTDLYGELACELHGTGCPTAKDLETP